MEWKKIQVCLTQSEASILITLWQDGYANQSLIRPKAEHHQSQDNMVSLFSSSFTIS